MFKDPPVPFSKIMACRVSKHKTLMQIALHKREKVGFGQAAKSENDPETILQNKLEVTYGKGGKIDIYN